MSPTEVTELPRGQLVTLPDTRPACYRQPLAIAEINEIAGVLFAGGVTGGASTKAAVAARILAGQDIGLKPVASVQNIMVLNGRPTVWGDSLVALVRNSGLLDSITEDETGEDGGMVATVTVTRVGDKSPPTVRTFSAADAKKSKLWGKEGPWQTNPRRQILIRARTFALRDLFADVLGGMTTAEEVADYADVKVTQRRPAAASPPLTLPSSRAEVPGKVTTAVLTEIAEERVKWLALLEIDPADKDACRAEWAGKLALFGVTTAADLSPERAADLLADLRNAATFVPPTVAETLAADAAAAFDGEYTPTPAYDPAKVAVAGR